MKNSLRYCLFVLTLALTNSVFTSCDDDDNNTPNTSKVPSEKDISNTTQWANYFVYNIMDYYYLYNEGISDENGDPVINWLTQEDTEEYFYSLVDEEHDRFSYITDDAAALEAEEKGNTTSMGWEYTLSLLEDGKEDVVQIIDYVYPNTPAMESGAMRGDWILKVNGETLNTSNYRKLLDADGEYTAARYNPTSKKQELVTYNLTARDITTSPVAKHNIFTLDDGTKVGYFLYLNFYQEFNADMIDVFKEFKAEGVTELILDLRYNPGGSMAACQTLASLIAPSSIVNAKKRLIYYEFNEYLTEDGWGEDNTTHFSNSGNIMSGNLNLDRVIILQGHGSYSASEATIIGLKAYMDVHTIGTTSGGKNTAMLVLSPSDFKDKNKRIFPEDIDNWLVEPLVAFYKNDKGESFDTTDGDGMDPDERLNEYSYADRGEVGTLSDPTTIGALNYIMYGSVKGSNNKSAALQNIGKLINAEKYKRIRGVAINR
ncbi:MAG: hypothetical protein HUJ96_09585 [Marinilabiliaceae bacterium]|nr:hypothetical protein [Marinilabiliaceae bacterium]